jgi:hypothetical protein
MLIEVCNKVTPPCYGGAVAGPGNLLLLLISVPESLIGTTYKGRRRTTCGFII